MDNVVKHLLVFGPFRLDHDQRLLLRDQQPIPLSPKAFDLLLVLVQRNGQLVLKDDLMQLLWPDTFVEESNLGQHVFQLRKALGETAQDSSYIVTVPGRGYRFGQKVQVVDEEEEESLVVESHSRTRMVIEEQSVPETKLLPARNSGPSIAIVVVTLLAVAGAAGVYFYTHRAPKLTSRDTVVLAEFTNSTGDAVFDGALRQGLSAQLEQSPFLNLLSDQRIAQTLSLMTQKKDSRLTPELAQEVCQRTASTALLNPSIAQIGTRYLLALKATSCSTGESLASIEAEAGDKNHVLDALGRVGSEIRAKLGESLASVQKYDAPPEDVTTPSLEALKAYNLGYRAIQSSNDVLTGIALLQRAVALDSDFAMAYARLGTAYFNLGETARGSENIRKAYDLRDRLSEREKFYIASHYEDIVMRNIEAARQTYELWLHIYPRDTIPLDNLCITYSLLGNHDKALMYCKKLFEFGSSAMSYANLVNSYLCLNQTAEAEAVAQEARAHNLDNPQIHVYLYAVDFLAHDAPAMEREAAGLMGKSGWEDIALYSESDTAASRGQFAEARALTTRAVEAAQLADKKEAAAAYMAEAAVRDALVGNLVMAQRQAKTALTLSGEREATAISAFALGQAGEPVLAAQLADKLEKLYPEDTIMRTSFLPAIRAAVALRTGDVGRALRALQAATSRELGTTASFVTFSLYPVFVRGEAHLAAKNGAPAALEFQKIIDHAGVVQNEPIGALAHLGLGRAYALSHDSAKARIEYQSFLTLWKDADPNIPMLKAAKAEYAELSSGEPSSAQ